MSRAAPLPLSSHTRGDGVPLLLSGTTTPAQRLTLSSRSCFHNNHCHLDEVGAASSPSTRRKGRRALGSHRRARGVPRDTGASRFESPGMSGSGPTQVPTSTAAAEALLSRHACLRARPVRTPARPRPLARPQPSARILSPAKYLFSRHDFARHPENLKLATERLKSQPFLSDLPAQTLTAAHRPTPSRFLTRPDTKPPFAFPKHQRKCQPINSKKPITGYLKAATRILALSAGIHIRAYPEISHPKLKTFPSSSAAYRAIHLPQSRTLTSHRKRLIRSAATTAT